ncbi:IS3 family transposase, partial [Xanthomonas campestris]|uniref:IS3 family transposase n=1 Tax=Xanthomonas campestris TaxID=339 RepID=UPI001E522A92
DKPDDLLGAESALLHVRPLGFTDFIASAGTAQWGQVKLAQARRRFGYRRLHDLLRPEFPQVNHKKIYRLYREA